MSLYQYLILFKDYTEDEALETLLRYKTGMKLPEYVLMDIKEYYKESYAENL